MKIISLIFAFALTGAFSLPFRTLDDLNNHRWTLVKDGERKMHLLDLNPIELQPEPAFIPEEDMFFLLFTRSNPTVGQLVTWTEDSIRNSNFRPNAQTRFLIHGWTASANSGKNPRTRDAFLQLGDHNVIVVDWSVGAGTVNYITARNRVGPTGAVVARLIDFLHLHNFVDHSQVNIIGHSLGSHVAGHAGKEVQRGKVNAIFGTDPAGPLFTIGNPDGRLDVNDAVYTEAIHTDVGVLGFDEPITHAAFYPHWGATQPGCGVEIGSICNHHRATFLYSESVNSNAFVSRQCTDYAQIVARNCPGTGAFGSLGGDHAKSIRGVFFLETNAESPFARG